MNKKIEQDAVLRMAKEAGLALTDHGHPEGYAMFCERLERFAALVRAEERKRTVEILMELHRKANGQHYYYHFAANEIQGFSV